MLLHIFFYTIKGDPVEYQINKFCYRPGATKIYKHLKRQFNKGKIHSYGYEVNLDDRIKKTIIN
jgi:hypothetical protein